MKTLQIEVPDSLAERVARLVEAGWFASEAEAGRFALTELVSRQSFEFQDRFHREDIDWAREQKTDR